MSYGADETHFADGSPRPTWGHGWDDEVEEEGTMARSSNDKVPARDRRQDADLIGDTGSTPVRATTCGELRASGAQPAPEVLEAAPDVCDPDCDSTGTYMYPGWHLDEGRDDGAYSG